VARQTSPPAHGGRPPQHERIGPRDKITRRGNITSSYIQKKKDKYVKQPYSGNATRNSINTIYLKYTKIEHRIFGIYDYPGLCLTYMACSICLSPHPPFPPLPPTVKSQNHPFCSSRYSSCVPVGVRTYSLRMLPSSYLAAPRKEAPGVVSLLLPRESLSLLLLESSS